MNRQSERAGSFSFLVLSLTSQSHLLLRVSIIVVAFSAEFCIRMIGIFEASQSQLLLRVTRVTILVIADCFSAEFCIGMFGVFETE